LISGGDDMSFMGLDNDKATLSVGKQPNREISVNINSLAQYVQILFVSKKGWHVFPKDPYRYDRVCQGS
jgi:hypothetical protein